MADFFSDDAIWAADCGLNGDGVLAAERALESADLAEAPGCGFELEPGRCAVATVLVIVARWSSVKKPMSSCSSCA